MQNLDQNFYRFAKHCVDFTRDRSMTPEQIADQALGLFRTRDEIAALDRALDDALSGRLSDTDLSLEWKKANSQMWFNPSPRHFLETVRVKLRERL